MSKAGKFAKILKLITSLLAFGLKLSVSLVVRIIREIFKGIGKRLRFSITFKTATMYALIFSTVLIILSAVLIASFGAFLLYETRNSLERNAMITEGFVRESGGIPESRIKRYAEIEGIVISLFNIRKSVTYTTAENKDEVVFNQASENIPQTVFTNKNINLTFTSKFRDDIYYIQVSRPLWQGKMYMAVLVSAITIGFLPAVLFTVIIGSRTLKKMLRPIDNMISTARAISASDLGTRLNVVDSHDELKELAETFNEMLDRIQASYEKQNRFVSDASHELRTPISVIQGYANLLQRWGKEDRAVLDESVTALKNEADSMKDLVERLLFLARADKNTQKLNKMHFSVNELVDEVLRETRLIDNQHNISGNITGLITLNADRGLIKQALRVFVDNSIKFTPPGGNIGIDGCLKGNQLIMTVEDNGTGIPREDLPFVFDRFYKCDKSRTRGGGGTGLGLSIAKWIIEKHQGSIMIDSTLNIGTKIIFILPT